MNIIKIITPIIMILIPYSMSLKINYDKHVEESHYKVDRAIRAFDKRLTDLESFFISQSKEIALYNNAITLNRINTLLSIYFEDVKVISVISIKNKEPSFNSVGDLSVEVGRENKFYVREGVIYFYLDSLSREMGKGAYLFELGLRIEDHNSIRLAREVDFLNPIKVKNNEITLYKKNIDSYSFLIEQFKNDWKILLAAIFFVALIQALFFSFKNVMKLKVVSEGLSRELKNKNADLERVEKRLVATEASFKALRKMYSEVFFNENAHDDKELKKISICVALEDALHFLTPVTLKKEISIVHNIEKDFFIEGSNYILVLLILNLVSLAVKRSPDKEEVRIFISKSKNNYSLTVEDNGYYVDRKNLSCSDAFNLPLDTIYDLVQNLGLRVQMQKKPLSGNIIILSKAMIEKAVNKKKPVTDNVVQLHEAD